MNLQSNVDFVTMLRAEVIDTVPPLLQSEVTALGEVRCTPLHLTLLESIQFVYKLGDAHHSTAGSHVQHLLVRQACYALPYVYLNPLPYQCINSNLPIIHKFKAFIIFLSSYTVHSQCTL